MKIGNKLKRLREFHNYTQEYVAENINISTSQYCKYEKEGTPITTATIGKIASLYKITAIELLGWDETAAFNLTAKSEKLEAQILQNGEYIEAYIKQLQNENTFLKEENSRLWSMIEKLK